MKYTDSVTIRWTKEEIAIIEKAAKYEKITPCEFIRRCVNTNYLNHPNQNAIMDIQVKIAKEIKAVLQEHLPSVRDARRKRSA